MNLKPSMNSKTLELVRYLINGGVATIVHFSVLSFNLKVVHLESAGLANLIAALFGISASFLGNRYFVFPTTGEAIITQALKFGGLYGVIAIFHGLVLLIWTDWYALDYRLGFLIATAVQLSLSYVGNKLLVFKK